MTAVRERRSWVALPVIARPLWWVSPVGCLALIVPVTLLVATQIPDADYRLFYKAPRVITFGQAELFLGGAALLALGTLIPLALDHRPVRRDWPRLPEARLGVLRRAEPVLFWLTIVGYVLYAGSGFAHGATPSSLLGAITSQSNYSGALKDQFVPVAGITSLTQIGIAYVVVAGLLLGYGRTNRLTRRLLLVVVLGLLRSYLLTERLALLELLVPLVAVGASHLRHRRRTTSWLSFLPVLALPVLIVVFGAFEYSRSWQFYKAQSTQGFPGFVIERLAGYYATSYNNGSLQLEHLSLFPHRLPYDSIQAFWTAPGIAQLHLYPKLAGQNGSDLLNTVLMQYGNPEFNNPGGLAVPFIDWGRVGGLIFFLLAGLVVGLAYRSWRAGSPVGLLVYPVLFTGLLELPRYLYWTQGRVFPPMVALLLVAWFMHRADRAPARLRATAQVTP